MFGFQAFAEVPYSFLTGEHVGIYTEQRIYAASMGYTTNAIAKPASTYFEGRLDVPLRFERSVIGGGAIAGQASVGFGDIELNNSDGFYDNLTNSGAVDGRQITVKVGIDEFNYSDFGVIFSGTSKGIAVTENGLRLLVRDFGYKLDNPIQSEFYSGAGGIDGDVELKGKPKPLLFGKALNISPVLAYASGLLYQISSQPLRSVDAVYDRGALLSLGTGYTVNLSQGTITLLTQPAGQITVDAVGDTLTPLAVLAGGMGGSWIDISDISSMYTDYPPTIKATATGQSIAYITDKSGNGLHFYQPIPSCRPLLQQDESGHYYLDFDGIDDFLVAVSEASFSFTAGITAAVAVRLDDWATVDQVSIVSKSISAFGNDSGYDIGLNHNSKAVSARVAMESANKEAATTTALAAGAHVLVGYSNLKGVILRADKTQIGAYYQAYQALIDYDTAGTVNLMIGAAPSDGIVTAGEYMSGRLYGAVFLGRAPKNAEMVILENYLMSAAGITARAPVCAADIIEQIARVHAKIADSEIDNASLSEFRQQQPAEIGYYIDSQADVSATMTAIMAGVGGWYGFSRSGLLQAAVFTMPSAPSVFEFTEIEILEIERLLLPESINPPNWRRQVGYQKNWTIQNNDLAGIVTAERRQFLANDQRVAVSQDANLLKRHRLATDPELTTSYFSNEADAQAEAERLMSIYGAEREMYSVVLKTQPFVLDIGNIITLTYPRWTLTSGKQFVIIRISEDATDNKSEITVFG